MLVFTGKRRRRRVVGGGFLDWIPSTLASVSSFISANKDTIKNVADVVGSVAKAGPITTSAVKQIVDVVKSRRVALPKSVEKELSEKASSSLNNLQRHPISTVG